MIANETRGFAKIFNIARSAGAEQILGFTRLQKSSFWAIFLVLSTVEIATAIILIPQFENADEINFQNQIPTFFQFVFCKIKKKIMSMGPT